MNDKQGIKAWLNERFPLSTFDYEVPPHANTLPFSLGGITAICVIVLIITGFILTQFYIPSPDAANQSIRAIMTRVRFGFLVRGIHVWAAQLAIICLFLHLLRVLFYGSYKKPREINWYVGVVLFLLMIGLFFSGTVIKWDQEGYEALAHTIAVGKMIGGPLAVYLAPNDTSLLSKFFSLHTSILPILLVLVLVVHVFLVKALKISPLPWIPRKAFTGKQTFARHVYKLGGYFFIVLGLLVVLAVFFPPSIGPLPVKGIESSKPPWPFMPIFSVENWVGIAGLVYGSTLLVLLLLLVPLLDRSRSSMIKERKGMVISSALAALLVAGLMINAYVTKPKQHIGMGGGGEAAVGGQQGLSTPQVIAEGLNITKRLEKALAAKNITTATDAAEKLDSTLDPLKDAIADRNPGLEKTLATDSLIDALKNARPDFARATALTDTMEKGLQQAKTLFPPPSTVDRINADLNLVGQIKAAIGANDFKTALDEAATLDENVDPLKDAIQDKAPDLINALNVEALTDNLEEANPDSGEIDSSLDAMTAALNRAKTLFSQDQSKEGG